MAAKISFISLCIISLFVSPTIALTMGIAFAFILKHPYAKHSKIGSKYFLQIAVVGLGFGINLHESLETGWNGVLYTFISVVSVMCLGYFIGKALGIAPKLTHLISSGTAICGGSAIAAIAPIVDADDNETSMSLAVIFLLNAIALFIFPPIGRLLALTQEQFGLWAAIAIHDTSSVVGAGAAYGAVALKIATTTKLTRALWIIPLSLVSILLFKKEGNKKIYIPWFILFFILAIVFNTYVNIPEVVLHWITILSHKLLSITLFLIGTSISLNVVRSMNIQPIAMGVSLWFIISITSIIFII